MATPFRLLKKEEDSVVGKPSGYKPLPELFLSISSELAQTTRLIRLSSVKQPN